MVTCDVSVFSFSFTAEDFPGVDILPTSAVQKILWQKLDVSDAFSVGSVPYQLASVLKKEACLGPMYKRPVSSITDGRLALSLDMRCLNVSLRPNDLLSI